MILGIGVDIIHLPRIKTLISKRGIEGFARRVLSPIEYQNFFNQYPKDLQDPVQQQRQLLYLGSRWCIKEATYKALYPTYRLEWKQVTVNKHKGKPMLHIENSKELGIKNSHVSLSHDGEYAIAQVVLEKKD